MGLFWPESELDLGRPSHDLNWTFEFELSISKKNLDLEPTISNRNQVQQASSNFLWEKLSKMPGFLSTDDVWCRLFAIEERV